MNQELKKWTIAYVKHRDLTLKRIKTIDEDDKNNAVKVHFKDKTNIHFILDSLDANVFNLIKNVDQKTVVCLNKEDNFKFLIKEWKKFSEIKNFTIIFVNLQNDDKWLINPHVHSMIADPASLEIGLRAMFDTANGKVIEIKQGKKKASIFEEGVDEMEDDSEEK